MKKAWMLAGLLWAGVALGQSVGQEGQKVNPSPLGGGARPPDGPIVCGYFSGDTTYRCLHLTTEGYLSIDDPNRDRTKIFSQQIIGIANGGVSLAVGAADSLANPPITAYPWRHWVLFIKAVPGTGTGTVTRLAVNVRAHITATNDSIQTASVYQFADFPAFHGPAPVVPRGLTQSFSQDSTSSHVTVVDTLLVGHLLTGSASTPWSGEFIVDVAANRNSPGNAVAATAWSYPNTIAIPLDNIFGRDFWAPYLSVRIRNMAGPTCVVAAWLVATPL